MTCHANFCHIVVFNPHFFDFFSLCFHRQKSGFPWFGQEKTEKVNGYEAKVFSVSGVEMVTRTRTEHMSEDDLRRLEGESMPVCYRSIVASISKYFKAVFIL